MSKQEKLLRRLRSRPKDFTWAELATLLGGFGFELHAGSGSGRKFIQSKSHAVLMMHEPHPGSVLKSYQVRAALDFLRQEGYLGE